MNKNLKPASIIWVILFCIITVIYFVGKISPEGWLVFNTATLFIWLFIVNIGEEKKDYITPEEMEEQL